LVDVYCVTAKNLRQGLTLAFPSAAPSKPSTSIPPSLSDESVLQKMGHRTQMYAFSHIIFFTLINRTSFDAGKNDNMLQVK